MGGRTLSEKFQFYDSTIKSDLLKTENRIRLSFQFYDSTIKSSPVWSILRPHQRFQFYDSTIKSRESYNNPDFFGVSILR